MVRSVAAALMLLALMVPFDAPWGASDALSGLQGVSAARREVEVGAGGDADEEDEYDDEGRYRITRGVEPFCDMHSNSNYVIQSQMTPLPIIRLRTNLRRMFTNDRE